MGGTFKSFLLGVYVLVRGRSNLRTTVDSRVYRYVHDHGDQRLNIVCKRLYYRVRYQKWYMIDRRYIGFMVSVTTVRNSDNSEWPAALFDWPTAIYPSMSPWFMENSDYQYFQAINAYIDNVIDGIKEKRNML